MISISLPYPPSINNYWSHGRTHLKAVGKNYRKKVISLCGNSNPIEGALKVVIEMYPPDNRRRDIDNILKALLDALEHAKVYENDYQISDLHIRRCDVVKGGEIQISIEMVENDK